MFHYLLALFLFSYVLTKFKTYFTDYTQFRDKMLDIFYFVHFYVVWQIILHLLSFRRQNQTKWTEKAELQNLNFTIFHLIFMQILFAKWSFLWVISAVYESTDQHIKSTDFFLRKRGFSVVKSAFKFSYFILKKYL